MESGFLLLDKPAGMSSAQALAPLKQRFGRRARVGHAGTLDPFATGLLLALVGDATRLSALAMTLPKTYRATVAFGRETDTLDPTGEVVAERDPGHPPASLAEALARFQGEHEQQPPAYSALKVEGRRAYRVARGGTEPVLAPRRVVVHRVALLATRWPEVELELACGAGFYVRAFARDLGRVLGLPAHLAALRRTAIGPFRADDGVAPEEAADAPLADAFALTEAAGLPVVDLDAAQALSFVSGRVVPGPGAGPAAVRSGGLFLGLGEVRKGILQPTTVLASARRAVES